MDVEANKGLSPDDAEDAFRFTLTFFSLSRGTRSIRSFGVVGKRRRRRRRGQGGGSFVVCCLSVCRLSTKLTPAVAFLDAFPIVGNCWDAGGSAVSCDENDWSV